MTKKFHNFKMELRQQVLFFIGFIINLYINWLQILNLCLLNSINLVKSFVKFALIFCSFKIITDIKIK